MGGLAQRQVPSQRWGEGECLPVCVEHVCTWQAQPSLGTWGFRPRGSRFAGGDQPSSQMLSSCLLDEGSENLSLK